jgi:NAD(P)-dependent dehydrogenase (short-subunit alcohol dehydrogenase family)
MTSLRFDDRVAVVTGAGNGLGRAYALELARRGAAVVVNDVGSTVSGGEHSDDPADRVVDEIVAAGGAALADHHSVADAAHGESIVERALHGFGRIDIVVNNAGILRDRPLEDMTYEEWEDVQNVHLNGTFHVTQAAWRHMKRQRYGRIISTASGAGIFGNAGHANYGAAKMGVVGLTRMVAVEGRSVGVNANIVAPAALTRMSTSSGKRTRGSDVMGTLFKDFRPELVAPLVAWLAHESCPTTGEIFSAGGGRVARVFIAEADGWVDLDISAEKLRDEWEDICSPERGFTVPRSMSDEIAQMVADFTAKTKAPVTSSEAVPR